jgi:vitamin B12/bleomycin/antimicrobial peptide transport system ATP-binding/permease protein
VDLSTDLGIGLLQSTLLLGSFITVLWTVSVSVTFSVAGWNFGLPGYMVWFALIYAGIASFGSWRVGRPLIGLNAERYAREADLRFGLVRVDAVEKSSFLLVVAVFRLRCTGSCY